MIDDLLRGNFGVVSAAQLVAAGLSRREIRRLVDADTLTRLRHGWFASRFQAHREVVGAVRAQGVLSCVSALRLRGLWTPPQTKTHLRRTEDMNGRRVPSTMVCCRPPHQSPPTSISVDPLGIALLTAVNCVPTNDAVVLLDSALNRRKLSILELEQLFTGLPSKYTKALDLVEQKSESGTETYVRLWLKRHRFRFRVQVPISQIAGRVDFLVGDRLVIEVDSREHHTDPMAYARDRRRDLILMAMDYRVVRLTYENVMHNWAAAEQNLLAILRRGDHTAKIPAHRRG